MPFRALGRALRAVARALWSALRHALPLLTVLLLFGVVGVYFGLQLQRDLIAFHYQYENLAAFGPWYLAGFLFAFGLAFALVWTHVLWRYYVLGLPTLFLGDPANEERERRQRREQRRKLAAKLLAARGIDISPEQTSASVDDSARVDDASESESDLKATAATETVGASATASAKAETADESKKVR